MKGPRAGCRWVLAVVGGIFRPPMGVVAMAFVIPVLPVGGFGYYDPSTFDREKSYAYLEKVEESVGSEEFGKIAYDHAFYLAQRMGPIDLYNVSNEDFVEHVLLAGVVGARFYREAALEDEDFKRYLLPLRIRSESTARPQWRKVLKETLEPLVVNSGTANDAARALVSWMAAKVTCEGDLPAYRLSERGDLDPIRVLADGKGCETDLAVFGVAAFRSVGIAARIVWTPTLDGMIGGKVWVEFRTEDGKWDCWVPSLGAAEDQGQTLRELLQGRAAVVLTHPEAPFEVTNDYLETIELAFDASCEGWEKAVMTQGILGIDPVYDAERGYALPDGILRIGRSPVLVALTRQDERYVVLSVQPGPGDARVTVTMEDGTPRAEILKIENHETEKQDESDG